MYSRCTTKEFKTDISQLCENCPLLSEIPKAIEERIIFQAKEYYSIDPETILDYIQSEISKAHTSMNQMQIESKKEGVYFNKISEIYIWNKERIKALIRFKNSLDFQKVDLPNELNSNEAKIYFLKAIEAGLMESTHNGFEWKDSQALLAYFTEKIYCKTFDGKDNGKNYPETALNKLFNRSRLGKARSQLADNKSTNGKPKRYDTIDKLFENEAT